MSNGTTVEFTEEAVKKYLDRAIRNWRLQRMTHGEGNTQTEDLVKSVMATHYVDAFQSVRVSLFGEALPGPDGDKGVQYGAGAFQ